MSKYLKYLEFNYNVTKKKRPKKQQVKEYKNVSQVKNTQNEKTFKMLVSFIGHQENTNQGLVQFADHT